jgi:uncharacterized protein YlxW (UPF0749 family)
VSDQEPRPTTPPPLLESLVLDSVDPGYQRAAQRRKAGGRTPSSAVTRSWLAAGTLVVGLLLAVAFQTTKANSAGVNQAREGLMVDVSQAQDQESLLAASVSALNDEVRAAQSVAVGAGGLASLTTLEQMNSLLPVSGPGLRVTLNDPDAATGNGAILDKDIQLLVNGLWSSGAEAIAIGGVRLRGTSAIRQAGGAILVDNRPVLWPMTIDAIGNPATIHQTFISTPGFGRFSSFVQLYDVTFDVLAMDSLSLPAAAAVDPHYVETGAADPATAATTMSPEPTTSPGTPTATSGGPATRPGTSGTSGGTATTAGPTTSAGVTTRTTE